MVDIYHTKPKKPEFLGVANPIHSYVVVDGKVCANRRFSTDEEGNIDLFRRCYGAYGPQGPLFCSQAFTTVDAVEQMDRVLKYGYLYYKKHYNISSRPYRVSCCQLAQMDSEEYEIRRQHRTVNKLNGDHLEKVHYCHMLLPTEPLYYTSLSKRLVEVSMIDLRTVTKEITFEALSVYTYWFSLDLEKIIPSLAYSNTEEYELEKRLKDFCHEARSKILRSIKSDINVCLREIDKIE